MLRVLIEEDGFDIKQRELVRVRTKNRWLLRIPTSERDEKTQADDGRDSATMDFLDNHVSNQHIQNAVQGYKPVGDDGLASPQSNTDLNPGVIDQTEERKRKMEADSAERYAAKKRRRRTRAYAGMPADPPAPPRFPSETTLSESQRYLDLDKETYSAVRGKFQSICEEDGILKKTVAGPERWEAAKERLISEIPHLQSVMRVPMENTDLKKLALDVICCDVTKRMRAGGDRGLLLAEAKNILSLNPEESRVVRFAFYRILKADNFTSKLIMGAQRWQELKQKWIDGSELLQRILARLDDNHSHEMKIKAVEALAKDVMKRLRDDQTRRGNTKKKQGSPNSNDLEDADFDDDPELSAMRHDTNGFGPLEDNEQLSLIPDGGGQGGNSQAPLLPPDIIDPRLELPIDAHLDILSTNPQAGFVDQHFGPFDHTPAAQIFQPPASNTVPIYLRPHPASTYAADAGLWIAFLAMHTVDELRHVAVDKLPGAICAEIEGVFQDVQGDVKIHIKDDLHLAAYLAHLSQNGGSPTFDVQLLHRWKDT